MSQTQKIIPLICIPSPREIPEFIDCILKLNYDKYWCKYYFPPPIAYREFRRFFLENTQYTHLVVLPDDLLVSPEDVETLKKHLETNPEIKILSGFCNIDTTDLKNYVNICTVPVNDKRDKRKYVWLTFDEFYKYAEQNKDQNGLVTVKFAGYPLMFIAREVVEKIQFRNDSHDGMADYGCCLDVTFCYDALQLGYSIYVDPKIRLQHLKINDSAFHSSFAIGKKKPFTSFEKKKD